MCKTATKSAVPMPDEFRLWSYEKFKWSEARAQDVWNAAMGHLSLTADKVMALQNGPYVLRGAFEWGFCAHGGERSLNEARGQAANRYPDPKPVTKRVYNSRTLGEITVRYDASMLRFMVWQNQWASYTESAVQALKLCVPQFQNDAVHADLLLLKGEPELLDVPLDDPRSAVNQ